jgi:aspergillopepsin I
MGLFNALLLLKTLLAFTIPPSLGTSTSGKTFTLEQVAVKRQSPWSSAESVRRAHLKYHLRVPAEVEEAVRREAPPAQGTVPTRSFNYDQMYIINVQVGNHTMALDLDTGSSDM